MSEGRNSILPSPAEIRLLLVHDNQLVAWALERLAELAGSAMAVVGKIDNAGGALQAARQLRPDVVLVGLSLGTPALNLIPRLVKLRQLRVIVLANVHDEQLSDRAVIGGARGLLHQEDSVSTIVKAIRKVHSGELWLDRATSGRIFGLLTQDDAPVDPDSTKIASLTLRERNIIVALARAASARHRVIADLLGMSEHTLRNHLSKIYSKLDVTGHFELYLYAKRHGLDQARG
ncbi:MAG TPA: response regulator transcription factor [Rudaea sp.]|nr:response regulator transcription factor [Rudaea sp.]